VRYVVEAPHDERVLDLIPARAAAITALTVANAPPRTN
jgi:hypothetical protein